MAKAVSAENLAEFKELCDETYATRGDLPRVRFVTIPDYAVEYDEDEQKFTASSAILAGIYRDIFGHDAPESFEDFRADIESLAGVLVVVNPYAYSDQSDESVIAYGQRVTAEAYFSTETGSVSIVGDGGFRLNVVEL